MKDVTLWFGDKQVEVDEDFIVLYDKRRKSSTLEIPKKSILKIESIELLFMYENSVCELKELQFNSYFDTVSRNIKQFFNNFFSRDIKYFFILKKNQDKEYFKIIFKYDEDKTKDFWIYKEEAEDFWRAFEAE